MEQIRKNVSPYSNDARNKYVTDNITNTLIDFLKERPISEISISEICQNACVGRTSFYRNYETKEDVIKKYIRTLTTKWQEEYNASGCDSNSLLYGSLFKHLKDHSDFFLLLKKRELFHLYLEVFIDIFGAKPDDNNMVAYTKNFITYGTFGWIEEWIARGMVESADTMTAMLSAHGMK